MFRLNALWTKVLHDLWLYKARTVVVITAIAFGVTGFGMVRTAQIVITENYDRQFREANPAHVRIALSPFGDSFLRNIRELPNVQQADARYLISTRVELAPGRWVSMLLQAVPDFSVMNVDKFTPVPGAILPPPKQTVLLERSVLYDNAVQQGETLHVRMENGKTHDLGVAGFVADPVIIPTSISSQVYGYISFDTSFWLEQDEKGIYEPISDRRYNRLLVITKAESTSKTEIESNTYWLKRDISRLGPQLGVFDVSIPDPGKPTLQDDLNAIGVVLNVAGMASLALSGFLVTNIMTALISQQIRQIGILKSMGARAWQIVQIYLSMAVILGGIALCLAVPLGLAAASALTAFICNILNCDVQTFYLPLETLALQTGSGLLVTILAALLPALDGARISAREAIASAGPTSATFGGLLGLFLAPVQSMSMPVVLSVRNVFRRRVRLLLTLSALSIGGATFIAVIGARRSLSSGIDDIISERNFDIMVRYLLYDDTIVSNVEHYVLSIPGVTAVETWKVGSMRRIFADNTETGSISMIAVSPDTHMLNLLPTQGRWLAPDGRNTLYVNYDALELLGPDALTSPVKMDFNGTKELWQVVGVGTRMLVPQAYMREKDFDRYVKQSPEREVVVQTAQSDAAFTSRVESDIMALFKTKKWQVEEAETFARISVSIRKQTDNVIVILLVTALLVAVIGGLGLANTLELNVMERTREIGILRSLGAKNHLIRLMVITESFTIGAISIVIGTLLSAPLGSTLSNVLGRILMERDFPYDFPANGLLMWIGIVGALALVASLAPAQSAISLTVRDTLAYEG